MIKIEFEGIDGCGKTTALAYLESYLQFLGFNTVVTREVGNPHIPICKKLREIVLDPKLNLNTKTQELIFSAMRIENELWLNNLQQNNKEIDFVLSDRGLLSHYAYSEGMGESKEFTTLLYKNLMEKYTNYPDFVFYLDIEPENAAQRIALRNESLDAIEIQGIEKQKNIKNKFEYYLNEYTDKIRIVYLNANENKESVEKQIKNAIDNILKAL